MRNLKELWTIVYEQFKNPTASYLKNGRLYKSCIKYRGICHCIRALYENEVITMGELDLLTDDMAELRPKEFTPVDYWWNVWEQEPRIEWMENRIKNIK